MQQFIRKLEVWFATNRLSASPQKSTVTLLTPDRRESNIHPHIILNDQRLPLNKTPTLLGLTYDTHMTFTPHVNRINLKAQKRANSLRYLTNTNYGQQKESLTTLYKQFIRTSLNYATPAWHPSTSQTNRNKLQTTQNKALRTITGCTRSTPVQHLHDETPILPLEEHQDMIGTQFFDKTSLPNHPNHHIFTQPPPSRNKKQHAGQHYRHILNTIPPTPPDTNKMKHIHTTLTQRYLHSRHPNPLTGNHCPDVHISEQTLNRKTRTTLAQLRTGHSQLLGAYRHQIGLSNSPTCTRCNTQQADDTKHLLLECPALDLPRSSSDLRAVDDLWARPVVVGTYLSSAGLI